MMELSLKETSLKTQIWICTNPEAECEEAVPKGACCFCCANRDECIKKNWLCEIAEEIRNEEEHPSPKDCEHAKEFEV